MKKFLVKVAPLLTLAFMFFLLAETIARALSARPGDPLIPLGLLILMINSSSIYYAIVNITNTMNILVTKPAPKPQNPYLN